MLLQKQANRHRPEEGLYGDCFRTCIACFLHVKRDLVTNFMEGFDTEGGAKVHARVDSELREKFGAHRVGFVMPTEPGDGVAAVEAALDLFGQFAREMPYILTGKSKNGTNHCVIAHRDKIIWDPSLDDSGIVGPALCPDVGPHWGFEVICRPASPIEFNRE